MTTGDHRPAKPERPETARQHIIMNIWQVLGFAEVLFGVAVLGSVRPFTVELRHVASGTGGHLYWPSVWEVVARLCQAAGGLAFMATGLLVMWPARRRGR